MKYNIYLSSSTEDKIIFLMEILDYEHEYLKTRYYSIHLAKSKENNKYEVSRMIEISDILPYLESIYKNKNIKKYKVNNDISLKIIKLIYKALESNKLKVEDELLKINNVKIYNNILDYLSTNTYKLSKEKKDYKKTYINLEKEINKSKETYIEEYESYIKNKKNLKNYLISKKGSK